MKVNALLIITLLCGVNLACHQQAKQTPATQDSSLSKQPDGTLINADSIKASSTATNSARYLIVPGKAAGNLRLNESMDTLRQQLGKPDAGDNAMGKSMAFWYEQHDTSKSQIAVYASRQMGTPDENTSRIQQIRVTSPQYMTNDSIHTGTPYRLAAAHYTLKKVAEYGTNRGKLSMYDSPQGIAFEFGPDKLCKGIIVHRPGLNIAATYMAFHSSMQKTAP